MSPNEVSFAEEAIKSDGNCVPAKTRLAQAGRRAAEELRS
jgi:hypothetical protein